MDPIVIKQEQRKNWNGLANAWSDWGDVFELGASPVSKALFNMAGLKAGDQVLDIASGIGEPALSAGKIVGATGKVVGIDIAEEMIAQAKVRGSASANVEFLAVDAASYAIGGPYDAILSRFGFMFMPDYLEVFKTSYASLKSGGVLAFSVWDTPDKAVMISLAVGFFARELNLPAPPKGLPNPFCMANTDLVSEQLAALGFKDIKVQPVEAPFVFESVAHYLHFSRDLIPASINKIIAEASDAATVEALWQKFATRVKEFETAGGTLSLKSSAFCISATKP